MSTAIPVSRPRSSSSCRKATSTRRARCIGAARCASPRRSERAVRRGRLTKDVSLPCEPPGLSATAQRPGVELSSVQELTLQSSSQFLVCHFCGECAPMISRHPRARG